jgi:hypothetical protein
MRYKFLLVLVVLLAACSGKADREEPKSQSGGDSAVNSECEPTQTTDATKVPSQAAEFEPAPSVELPNLGPAPELTNEVWLNSDQPLRLADLKGKVVLLEMWTFG